MGEFRVRPWYYPSSTSEMRVYGYACPKINVSHTLMVCRHQKCMGVGGNHLFTWHKSAGAVFSQNS